MIHFQFFVCFKLKMYWILEAISIWAGNQNSHLYAIILFDFKLFERNEHSANSLLCRCWKITNNEQTSSKMMKKIIIVLTSDRIIFRYFELVYNENVQDYIILRPLNYSSPFHKFFGSFEINCICPFYFEENHFNSRCHRNLIFS